jgi:hypothetical protein
MSDLSLTVPSIEGKDLLQRPIRIPEDLPPGPCILLFAFSPGHQGEAMTWVPSLTDIASSGTVTVRQIIVLPAFAKMGERIALGQLSKLVPAEAHDATILAFADQGVIAKSVGATDTNHIAIVLLDAARRISWIGSGPHETETEAALRAQIAA